MRSPDQLLMPPNTFTMCVPPMLVRNSAAAAERLPA
jgi:hypothetical protein